MVVTNKDGAEETYTFQASDSTLPTAPIALSTLTLANGVKAYNLVSGVEYANGDQVPEGTAVRFVYPVAWADADAPNKATPFLVNSTGTAADDRDANGMLFIVREVVGATYTVGFNTVTVVDGTFTLTLATGGAALAYTMVPNKGATALPGHDGIDYFIYAKHSPAPGDSWMDIGPSGLTATGVTNWFTVAGTGNIRGSWDDFDNGEFHYTAEGKNGGTTQRVYYEFITLSDPDLPTEVSTIGSATVDNTQTPPAVSLLGESSVKTTDIVFDTALPTGAAVTMRVGSATGPVVPESGYKLPAAGDTVNLFITVTAADGIQSQTYEVAVTTI